MYAERFAICWSKASLENPRVEAISTHRAVRTETSRSAPTAPCASDAWTPVVYEFAGCPCDGSALLLLQRRERELSLWCRGPYTFLGNEMRVHLSGRRRQPYLHRFSVNTRACSCENYLLFDPRASRPLKPCQPAERRSRALLAMSWARSQKASFSRRSSDTGALQARR